MATKGRESIVLDEKLLKIEAEEAIREVSFAVEHVSMSKNLPSTDELVYMNLRTKDGGVFCVELSVQGFRVSHGPPILMWIVMVACSPVYLALPLQ